MTLTAENRKASEILTEAADTLTEEEWAKGSLYRVRVINGQGRVCRCAHGQIQWCGLGLRERSHLQDEANKIVDRYPGILGKLGIGLTGPQNLFYSVESMIHWGVDDREVDDESEMMKLAPSNHRPLALAHYYAGRVGLTMSFNDDSTRSYPEVIAKLREAATLALLEGNWGIPNDSREKDRFGDSYSGC